MEDICKKKKTQKTHHYISYLIAYDPVVYTLYEFAFKIIVIFNTSILPTPYFSSSLYLVLGSRGGCWRPSWLHVGEAYFLE